jgi:hypothetical protein
MSYINICQIKYSMLAERGREESHNPTNIIKISKTQVFEISAIPKGQLNRVEAVKPPIPPPLGDKNLLIKKKKKISIPCLSWLLTSLLERSLHRTEAQIT